MSEQESELGKALAQVQAELPEVKKERTAKVQMKQGGEYSYTYADLASISAQVLPLFAKNGLSWLTMPTIDDHGHFVLRYELLHSSGESRVGHYPLPDPSAKAQEMGSAITYARRYTLCSVAGVVPEDDDDGRMAQHAPTRQKQGQRPIQAHKPSPPSSPNRSESREGQSGEETVSVLPLVRSELNDLQRGAFSEWLNATYHCPLNAVPKSKAAEVESAVARFATGELPLDAGRPFE